MGSHYDGSPAEVEALSAFIKLTRAIDAVKARLDAQGIAGDLTDTQFGVLEALYHRGPMHQNMVGEKLLISKSNVVAVIDKLEAAGLVSRRRSDEDRRYIFVHLTEAGCAEIERLLPFHVASIVAEMSALTRDEQRELGRLCKKLGLQGDS